MLNNVDTAQVYTDFAGLEKLKQGAREQSPEAIKQVAKQFESVFMTMMMKSMRQAKLAEGILDSQQSTFYRDMYDQQMAVEMSNKGGVGLADMIARQLSPQQTDPQEKQDAMQLDDYINRAAGAAGGANMPARAGAHEIKALDASGLSSLERSLARLEKAQQDNVGRWQHLQEDLATSTDISPVNAGEVAASKQAFMSQMLPYAKQAAQELGVDANVLLAQAALETGWGQAVIKNAAGDSSNNLFNIKADKSWQGKQAKTVTLEYDGAVAKKEVAGFRAYDSYQDSFDDYVQFLKANPRYSDALKQAANPAHYVRELQQAGYATDPRYAEKVMRIYHSQASQLAMNQAN